MIRMSLPHKEIWILNYFI